MSLIFENLHFHHTFFQRVFEIYQIELMDYCHVPHFNHQSNLFILIHIDHSSRLKALHILNEAHQHIHVVNQIQYQYFGIIKYKETSQNPSHLAI